MSKYHIGLMSGTSMDAIDAVIVDFNAQPPKLIASHSIDMPYDIQQKLRLLCHPGENEINRCGEMDVILGNLFAQACDGLLKKASCNKDDIIAIGSHGQTIRHHPNNDYPFTLQIGDPNIIAVKTGITTVADFRRKNVALGGQGAPLTPAFHEYLFRNEQSDCVVVNIGGFANLTFLPCQTGKSVIGFDTGPGNWLMDAWIQKHLNKNYDDNGNWARAGKLIPKLLNNLLTDAYFTKAHPKSTGPEYFNLDWLQHHLSNETLEDAQHTLCELTATSICNEIKKLSNSGEVLLCGGGVNNNFLIEKITQQLPSHTIATTDSKNIAAKWLEAIAFAWFAKQTIEHQTLKVSSVTGSAKNAIAGGVYFP